MTLLVKPVGRGFRLVTELRISGGHMERALEYRRGQTFELGNVRWRIVEVRA